MEEPSPGMIFVGAVALDGASLLTSRFSMPHGSTPDQATDLVIRLTEDSMDRRLLGEAHQLPGRVIDIAVRRIA